MARSADPPALGLVTGGLPVAAVAERLGYLEVSSFSQSFRRWKGVSPRAYRARAPERMIT